MRIALNLSREYLGGITTTNINLMNQLRQSGFSFVGIEMNNLLESRAPEFYKTFEPRKVLDHRIIQIHHLPLNKVLKKAKSIADLEKYYGDIINVTQKILKETKPDVVLINGTFLVPWIISIAAKREKLPIVLRYAGILTKETYSWPPKARKIFSEMEISINQRAHEIIFPSQICKDTVQKEVYKKKGVDGYIIPNAISALFSQSTFVPSVERRIAAVGRYDKIKNLEAFIKIHKILLKRGWQHTASLITNKTKILGLPKTIQLIPPMTPEGLKEFYKTEGLIICPSLFETFGNVPMEAASLGIPVLVSDQMGCADILHQAGLENMVTSFADLNKVADKVTQLCGQYILNKQRSTIKKLLNPKFIYEEIQAVINKTLVE